jgi:hypothetical protein
MKSLRGPTTSISRRREAPESGRLAAYSFTTSWCCSSMHLTKPPACGREWNSGRRCRCGRQWGCLLGKPPAVAAGFMLNIPQLPCSFNGFLCRFFLFMPRIRRPAFFGGSYPHGQLALNVRRVAPAGQLARSPVPAGRSRFPFRVHYYTRDFGDDRWAVHYYAAIEG